MSEREREKSAFDGNSRLNIFENFARSSTLEEDGGSCEGRGRTIPTRTHKSAPRPEGLPMQSQVLQCGPLIISTVVISTLV